MLMLALWFCVVDSAVLQVAAASALLQRIRAVEPLQCIVDDMTAQVTDLIAMTLQVHKALPRGPGNQVSVDRYTMPANFRRRLTSLRHAPPICYSLPLDTTRRYEVGCGPAAAMVLVCDGLWLCGRIPPPLCVLYALS
jgi:hypothetical protein